MLPLIPWNRCGRLAAVNYYQGTHKSLKTKKRKSFLLFTVNTFVYSIQTYSGCCFSVFLYYIYRMVWGAHNRYANKHVRSYGEKGIAGYLFIYITTKYIRIKIAYLSLNSARGIPNRHDITNSF